MKWSIIFSGSLIALVVLVHVNELPFFSSKTVNAAAITWDGGGDGTTWEDGDNWSDNMVPGDDDDVTITSASVEINGGDTINSLSLVSSTLTFDYDATSDALIIDDGNLSIDSDSTVTHTVGTTSVVGTVYFDVQTGDVDVQGDIDVSGKGFASSEGPGAGDDNGFGGGNGASHGGVGGADNDFIGSNEVIYGSVSVPVTAGSGGGGLGGVGGGIGGGIVRIDVDSGTITVDGTINANAANATDNRGGGGAGGSIYIDSDTFDGDGTVSATGSSPGGWAVGGGGGGRIAIYYDTLDASSPTLSANGHAGNSGYFIGGAGTIYIKDNAQNPDLIIDNADVQETRRDTRFIGTTPLTPSGTPASFTFRDIDIQNDGHLDLNSDTTLSHTGTLTYSDDGIIADNGGSWSVFNTGAALNVPSGGTVFMNTSRSFSSVDIFGEVSHYNNHTSQDYDIDITSTGSIDLDASGTIDISSRGYSSSEGPGAGDDNGLSGGNGASHGGQGGADDNAEGSNELTYGSITNPATVGSGGGTTAGGYGGGSVRLTATSGTTTIDGTIDADASGVFDNRSGGGAGGGVYINASTIDGSGSISADGGAGGIWTTGGGGGGRVALLYDTLSFSTSSVTAYGGESNSGDARGLGGAGTIFHKDSTDTNGHLIIDNNDRVPDHSGVSVFSINGDWDRLVGRTTLTPSGTPASITYDSLTIQNQGELDLNSDTTLTVTSLTWTEGRIFDNGGTLDTVSSGALNVPTDATLTVNTATTYDSGNIDGRVRHSKNTTSQEYDLDLTFTNDLTVSATGSFNVDGLGNTYESGTGPGSDEGSVASGAGHGGDGGDANGFPGSGGSSYGSETSPTAIGSGGGSVNGGATFGSSGGGAVKLTVGGNFVLNGTVTADGGEIDVPIGSSGGGSGGSVWLDITGNLSGSGSLTADGDAASDANGGAGAGGRISYECNTDNSTITTSVAGGTTGGAAEDGTTSAVNCIGQMTPTGSFNSAAQKTDGSGHVDVSIEVDDANDEDTRAKIEYETDSDGACDGPWAAATLTGTASADFDDSGGAPDISGGAYQIGSTATTRIITSSGSNSVDFDWDSSADLPSADGTQCLRLTVNDDTADQDTPATQTVDVDNVDPSLSSITLKDTNNDGTVDRVDVVFDENLTLTSYESGDWTFPTPGTVNLDDTGASVLTTTVFVTVSADANKTGGTTDPTLTYTNNGRLTDGVGNQVGTFTAQTVADGAGPLILSTSPADGDAAVLVTSDVIVTFTEPIDTGTFAYSFVDAPGGESTAYSSGDTVATVSHTNPFSVGAHTFTVTATDDPDGNSLVGAVAGVGHPVNFTTASPNTDDVLTYVKNNRVEINDGDACAPSREVTVRLEAAEAIEFKLGADTTFKGAEWMPFEPTFFILDETTGVMEVPVLLSEDSGTVVAKFRSGTETESSAVSDSIFVDTETFCLQDTVEDAPHTDEVGISPITGEEEPISEVQPGNFVVSKSFLQMYYIGEDLRRHPLLSTNVLFTYEDDPSVVKAVTDATLAKYPLGEVLMPRSHSVLLKFLSIPHIFSIEDNVEDQYRPVLRQISSEELLIDAYEEPWMEYLYEINQSFYHHFFFGAPIRDIMELPLEDDLMHIPS